MAMRIRYAPQMSSGIVAGTAKRDSLFEASLTPEGPHRKSGAPIGDDCVDDYSKSRASPQGTLVIAGDPVVFDYERTSALAVLQLVAEFGQLADTEIVGLAPMLSEAAMPSPSKLPAEDFAAQSASAGRWVSTQSEHLRATSGRLGSRIVSSVNELRL